MVEIPLNDRIKFGGKKIIMFAVGTLDLWPQTVVCSRQLGAARNKQYGLLWHSEPTRVPT